MFYETALQRRALILTSLAHFVNDGVAMVPLSVFPLLLTMFGLAAPELGFVAAMWNIMSVIGSPAVGHLSDRLKRNSMLLVAGLIMMAAGIIGTGWSVSTGPVRDSLPLDLYPALLLFAAIGGLGSSVAHPVGSTVLTRAYPPSKIGKALGLNGSMGSLGRALYPSLVVILITFLSLPYGVVALGLFGLLPAALIRLFPVDRSRDDPAESDSRRYHHARQKAPPRSTSSPRFAWMSVLVLTTIALLRSTFTQGVASFLSVFIVEIQKYSFAFGVGMLMMISIILGVPAQLIFGYFSDLHRKAALVINTAGQSLAIVFYLYTLSNPMVATICLALFGFFAYSGYPVLLSVVSEAAPTESLSLSNSIVWGVGVLGGSAIGPIVVGLFVGNNLTILPTIFLALAVISGLSIGLVVLVPKTVKSVLTIDED